MNAAYQKIAFDRDILNVEGDIPAPFQFYDRGKTIPAQRQEILETYLGGDAGYDSQIDFEIIVRLSAYVALSLPLPNVEDLIEIDNPLAIVRGPRLSLAIKSVKPAQDSISVILGVKASN